MLAGCLVALPTLAGAQAAGRKLAPRPAAARSAAAGPAVGSSATYRWTSSTAQPIVVVLQEPQAGGAPTKVSVREERATPDPVYVTYGVVRADRGTYTLQIVTQERPGSTPLSVTQVTVNRGSGKAVRAVTRGPKGATRTPESGLRPLRESALANGRREAVTVPAGRFDAVQGDAAGGQVWVSDSVPALGLVKGTWPDGTLELVQSAPGGATDLLRTATR